MDFICKETFAHVAADCRDYKLEDYNAFVARVREQFGDIPNIPAEQQKHFNATLDYIADVLDFCAGKDVKLPAGDAEFYQNRWNEKQDELIGMNKLILPMIPGSQADDAVCMAEIAFMQDTINNAASLSWFRHKGDNQELAATDAESSLSIFFNQDIGNFDRIAATYRAGGDVMAFNHDFDRLLGRFQQQRPVVGALIAAEYNH